VYEILSLRIEKPLSIFFLFGKRKVHNTCASDEGETKIFKIVKT